MREFDPGVSASAVKGAAGLAHGEDEALPVFAGGLGDVPDLRGTEVSLVASSLDEDEESGKGEANGRPAHDFSAFIPTLSRMVYSPVRLFSLGPEVAGAGLAALLKNFWLTLIELNFFGFDDNGGVDVRLEGAEARMKELGIADDNEGEDVACWFSSTVSVVDNVLSCAFCSSERSSSPCD